MAEILRSDDGRIKLLIDPIEVELLSALVSGLLDLLDEAEVPSDGPSSEASTDPLAEMVGIDEKATRPSDPAMIRLFPDAYPDDAVATQDFRRFTQRTLTTRKRADAATVLEALTDTGPGQPDGGGGRPVEALEVDLGPDTVRIWLGSLNDLRLWLGTRLGVSDDAEGDPEESGMAEYHWLTDFQATLLASLR